MNVLSDDPRKKAEEAKTASATSSDLQLQKLLSTAEEAASKPAELGSFKPFSSNEEKQKRFVDKLRHVVKSETWLYE